MSLNVIYLGLLDSYIYTYMYDYDIRYVYQIICQATYYK